MKIALVAPYEYPYPGGVTEHISHLDECFREWGHDVKIIAACSQRPDTVQENLISVSSSIISLPVSGSISRISLSPGIYWPVKRLLEREQFDIIHLHEPLMPALPLIVLRHSKTVNIGTFHAYREEHPGLHLMRPLLQPFMAKLNARICVSRAAEETISQYFPDHYEIIPNGIDFPQFSDPNVSRVQVFDDGRPNILFVGRLEQRKGFRYLLYAYERLLNEIPDARLIVVGAYTREDAEPFMHYARERGLSEVWFEGRVSRTDLIRYYRTCDVFCAPSTGFESFGIVLLEAMAAGKPIVATDIAGYRTVLEDGKEGWMVPPEDEVALVDALGGLLRNPPLRAAMGSAGQRKAASYDWHLVARRVLDVYEQFVPVRSENRTYA